MITGNFFKYKIIKYSTCYNGMFSVVYSKIQSSKSLTILIAIVCFAEKYQT